MNKYFPKVTADYWTAKNKLQEEAKQVAREVERKIISKEQFPFWFLDFTGRIATLNAKHKRCTSLLVDKYNCRSNKEDICIEIRGVTYITLYLVTD